MKTSREQTIIKYYNILKKLKDLLDYTDSVSMMSFSRKNNCSKQLSTALQNGGIIKNVGSRGKGAKWVWNSIEPTREMAIRTISELSKTNPPRKKSNIKNKNEKLDKNLNNEPKEFKRIKRLQLPILWGLIKLNFNVKYEI